MNAKPAKRTAWKFGLFAETLAAWHLRFRGYRILARRFRGPVGEIDIVARRGRLLVFVEVKARRDALTAAESITPRQRNRIIRAAQAFVQARPALAALDQRFDAILIGSGWWPVHLVDAWRPEL
ncbi:MAG: YraN family protein [Rhodospirillales bacterium]|nr:YraN family protein [Alphaproteobacteria bacterium]MBL6948967.1 YraN family protein [Rhodospirillales bacterium]